MYKVLVTIADSDIDGLGVFARQDIPKSTIAWIFTDGHDYTMTTQAHNTLDQTEKERIDKTGYLSPWTGLWVFPPEGDPAQYTNHSNKNNLSVVYDSTVSAEPYFIANRDIKVGEELTNNYREFDKVTRETRPHWAN